MDFTSQTWTCHKALFFVALFLVCGISLEMASAGSIAKSNTGDSNLFAANILKAVVETRSQQNVIFSPASIQAAMALVYLGAEGPTADELQKGLHLGSGNKATIAANYGEFVRSNFRRLDGVQLKMANGIFVNENLKISPEFATLAEQSLNAEATPLKFANADDATGTINAWVESETNAKIKNLLQPGTVNAETSSVLVNAVYFKAKWAKQFSDAMTQKADFKLGGEQRQIASVDMMYNDDEFKYAELSDLNATALELPYENSDLSMLLLLPNDVNGLQNLEAKLQNVDLNDIISKLQIQSVDVFLPKFKLEFEMDLKEPLSKLGVTKVFSDSANLSALFASETPQKVSEAKHKAYLEVNEAGSEAAAATFMKITPMSLNIDQKRFVADHPFLFVIRNSQTVFFMGHVAKF